MKNITTLNQALRIALSLGIVAVVLSMSGPVGNLVYALFVSIYVGLTGFIGWDPVIALMSKVDKKSADATDHIHHNHTLQH